MSFTTAVHYSNGRTTGNSNLRVRSNKRFNVAVKAASAIFSTNSSTPMPVTNVLYVRRGTQAYINLSTSDQNIVTNAQRGVRNYNINYKATPGFNYDAGVYSVQVIYTATQL